MRRGLDTDRPWNATAAHRGLAVPHAGDRRCALGALAVGEAIRRDAESDPPDHQRLAVRAVRSFLVTESAGDVARIDVAEPRALADLVRAQEVRRRRRGIVHLVILVVR